MDITWPLLIYRQPVFTGKQIYFSFYHLAEVGTAEASLLSSELLLHYQHAFRREESSDLMPMKLKLKVCIEKTGPVKWFFIPNQLGDEKQ